MRGLIVTRGMSFRDGTRGTTSFGNDFAIESQKEATLSHSKLFHTIKDNYNVTPHLILLNKEIRLNFKILTEL